MYNRQQKIVHLLLENPAGLTATSLSKLCHVSTRTIRSDIVHINDEGVYHITGHTKFGYRIVSVQHEQMDNQKNKQPISRIIFILQRLFEGDVCLEELMRTLYISESTLNVDLNKIKQLIMAYPNLNLIRKKGILFLEGSEFAKRKLYKNLLSTELNQHFNDVEYICKFYPSIPLKACIDCFDKTLSEFDFSLRQEAKPILYLHLGILLERIWHKQYLRIEEGQHIAPQDLKLSQTFFSRLQEIMPLCVIDDEIKYLALLLQGYKTEFDLEEDYLLSGKITNISYLVNEIVNNAYVYSGIDFSKDKEFINGLHLHLQGLLKRLERDVILENSLIDTLKQQHPLVFDMAVYVCQRMEQLVKKTINESEIAFIALHLGVSYSRLSTQRKIQTILIANDNARFTSLIEHQILTAFSGKIEIIRVFDVWEDAILNTYDVDLIITLGQLYPLPPVPTVSISSFLLPAEERYIFDKIQEIERQQLLTDFAVQIEKLMDNRFYYCHLDLDNPSDVINYMTQQLVKEKIVSIDYVSEVLKREEASSTSFQQGFAVPHAMFKSIQQSVISVATLKKPIKWGRYTVQLVVLLALSESDRALIPLFFEGLIKLIENKVSLEKLLDACDVSTFLQNMMIS